MQESYLDCLSVNTNKSHDIKPSKIDRLEKTPNSKDWHQQAGNFVIAIVTTQMDVGIEQLKTSNRGKANICLARQCAMYLMHTSLSCAYYEVADYFGRDRTTISHACRIIEDMRDDDVFDEQLNKMELLINAAIKLAAVRPIEREEFPHGG